jgi:hypothetical protein
MSGGLRRIFPFPSPLLRALSLAHKPVIYGPRSSVRSSSLKATIARRAIGKTQLAVLYAHQYGDRHPKGVFWLSMADAAGSPGILLDRFASLARAVDLAPDEQGTPDRVDRSRAERWLSQYGGSPETLLVLDNLEDPDLLTLPLPGFPSHCLGHLRCRKLITTRQPELPGCRPVRLDFLHPPTDREVLLEAAGREPADAMEAAALPRLLAILGGLPLALRLTGALLQRQPGVRLDRLTAVLRDKGARAVLDGNGNALDDYRGRMAASLGAVLAETWSAIPADRPELSEAVEAIAVLPEARSWSSGLLHVLVQIPSDPLGLVEDPLPALLQELASRNLVERPDAVTVRLHPLVREFVRERAEAGLDARVARQTAAAVLERLACEDWLALREVLVTLEPLAAPDDAGALTVVRRSLSPCQRRMKTPQKCRLKIPQVG